MDIRKIEPKSHTRTGAHTPVCTHAQAKSPSEINVLIACEESQTECIAFLEKGFNVYSCDLQKCSGNRPDRHIQGDVLPILLPGTTTSTQNGVSLEVPRWDLVIAHPPCTYLSMVSASNSKGGILLDIERLEKGRQAAEFFHKFWSLDVQFLAVENPVPLHVFKLPRPTTMVQPYMFGEPWTKRTCLWLKNLPPLFPTIYAPKTKSWTHCTRGSKKRSKSFASIARAMADQWGDYVLRNYKEQ